MTISVIKTAINMGPATTPAHNAQESVEITGDFKYDEILRQISALGWSTVLRQLPELNFIQLYDYLVVSTCKYRRIVLKGTNYKKLKSYQFFYEGNVKWLGSKAYQGKTYVKASVLPLMKKNPYRVLVEFSPQCDILQKAGKTKVEPSNKVKSILYSNFTTDAVQYGIESEPKAGNLYIREMRTAGMDVTLEEVGLLVS